MRALGLVSGLAQAVIYGLGGYLALNGTLDAGAVVTLALLLNRLYAPLTALATARLDVATALVSFERVFEVLDIEPLITDADDAVDLPTRRAGRRRVRRASSSPTRPPTGSASPPSRRSRCSTNGSTRRCSTTSRCASSRARPWRWSVRPGRGSRRSPHSCHACTTSMPERSGSAASTSANSAPASIRETVGVVTQDGHLFHDTIANNLRYARPGRVRRRAVGGARARRGGAARRVAARRARHHRRRARLPVLGRRAPAADDRSDAAARSARRRPRRGDVEPRLPSEAAVQAALDAALDGRTALVIAHRLSTDPRRRLDRGARPRPHRRAGHPRRTPRARRPVRRALPHPVRVGRDRASRHRRLGPGSTPRAPSAQRDGASTNRTDRSGCRPTHAV